MISLALSIAKPRPSSEAGEATAPIAREKATKGGFSAVLASLGQRNPTDKNDVTGSGEHVASGIALPAAAETGKILPDVAGSAGQPGSATPEETEDGAAVEDGASGEAIVIAAPLVQLPAAPAVAAMATPASAESTLALAGTSRQTIAGDDKAGKGAEAPSLPLQIPPADARPAQAPAGQTTSAASASLVVTPAPSDPENAGPSAQIHVTAEAGAEPSSRRADGRPVLAPATSDSDETALPAEAVDAQPQRERGERRDGTAADAAAGRSGRRHAKVAASTESRPASGREISADGLLIPRSASADPAPQAPSATFAQGLQAERTHAAKALDGAKPLGQVDALQDLTRVVDRLAAAREAFAPAAAALAVKHADFGDLSLRFEQQRDGHLAVQLSASDPDAHRAVAAAVSERSNAAVTDSNAGAGHSQAQTRGAAAERDGSGSSTPSGSNAERRDQPQQRRAGAQDGQHGNGTRRNGVFA